MDRIISLLAALVGLIALGGASIVHTNSDTQQQQVAATPTDALAQAGAKYFATSACIGCHAINGVTTTDQSKLIGPNLTHFGGRQWIAGGVVSNTPANLAAWLRNPQAVKDGADMPNLNLTQDQINELVAYLESLQ